MPKPGDIAKSYVVRTDVVRVRTTVVRIRTAAVRYKPIASMLQENWACRNPPCDVATDRTALRIRTTAVRSLANYMQFQSQAITRLSYGWCKQGPTAWTRANRTFRQAYLYKKTDTDTRDPSNILKHVKPCTSVYIWIISIRTDSWLFNAVH